MSTHKPSLPKEDRVQRAAKQQKRQARSRPDRIWLWVAGVVLVVAGVLAGAVMLTQAQSAQAAPGQPVIAQGRDHIAPGQSHPPYNSDPPTSGPHYADHLDAGFYEESHPDELLVHNLEHGHIVISYDCSKLTDCEGTKQQLRQLVQRFNTWKVVAVPRKNADAAIALTAWGRIDKLDRYDAPRIEAFINAWRDRGPEHTAD